MSNFPCRYRHLLVLLCAVLLVARVGGAHLHLCFDGKEPPISFHAAVDVERQPGTGAVVDAPHEDEEVSLMAGALLKPGKQLQDLPLFLGAVLLCWVLARQVRQAPRSSFNPSLPTGHQDFRPPLRGPPAFSH